MNERTYFGGIVEDGEVVFQPFDACPGDGDGTLESVVDGLVRAELEGDGGEELVLRGHYRRSRIAQHETARAVRVLHHPHPHTPLPHQRTLLIPQALQNNTKQITNKTKQL